MDRGVAVVGAEARVLVDPSSELAGRDHEDVVGPAAVLDASEEGGDAVGEVGEEAGMALRLPGVGVVVDRSLSSRLHLVPGAGLALRLPAGADTVVATDAATQALPIISKLG